MKRLQIATVQCYMYLHVFFLFFEMLGTSCWLLSFLVKNIMVSVYVHVLRDLLFFNVGVQLWPGQVCFVLHFLEFPFHPVGSSLYRRESDKEGLLWTRKSTEKQIYLLIFNLCEPQNMLYVHEILKKLVDEVCNELTNLWKEPNKIKCLQRVINSYTVPWVVI